MGLNLLLAAGAWEGFPFPGPRGISITKFRMDAMWFFRHMHNVSPAVDESRVRALAVLAGKDNKFFMTYTVNCTGARPPATKLCAVLISSMA